MLWLALQLPHLPLDVFTRGASTGANAQPLAITSGPDTSASIVAANRAAQARGVTAGMVVSAAYALAAGLNTLTRDITKERATLARLAAWSQQFTSLVSIAEPDTVLLEIAGSLKLFGGLNKLTQHIARGIQELGFHASLACAPTPLAAQWFARARVNVRVQHPDALRHVLEKLPAGLACDDDATHDLLENIGARTLGDCLKLPRGGLARRAGERLLDQLDRALGTRPDPRLPFVAPQTWRATLPLAAPVENAEALLFAARRLLAELAGWLAATAHGVQRPSFELLHEKQLATVITLELAAASRDLDHLSTLLRERLARTELPAPAIEITVASGRVVPLASNNLSFLPLATNSAGSQESTARFIEKINARLGAHAICGLTPHADYRPERAWRACRPGAGGNENFTSSLMPARPLWLLTTPRPLREQGDTGAVPHDPDSGALSLIAGPERIEAGWWDGQHAARDYFVARNTTHSLMWIYRERNAAARWYVHGFFS
ncbi:MAG: DNA polymerase Y family protein [Betaproteobacteria bacterium]|nr:DNA polymerase Y family protein [Betaproteobacteria bacterium]